MNPDMSPSIGGDQRYTVPALTRGLQLLTQFSRDERELSGAELARRLKVPRASIFRLLHTLEQMGFVERVGDSTQYRLGVAVLRLGFEYLASMELTEHGRPVLDALRNTTGYSAHLVVRDGTDVVFVGKAAGTQALFHSIQVGARLPAYATVLGRILLDGLDSAALTALFGSAPLKAYTQHTPTTLKKLKALIDQHHAQGFAISQSGFETGISTVAAPVFDDRHSVVAAVSITVPAQQIEAARAAILVKAVQDAAAQISARISRQSHPRSPAGTQPRPATRPHPPSSLQKLAA